MKSMAWVQHGMEKIKLSLGLELTNFVVNIWGGQYPMCVLCCGFSFFLIRYKKGEKKEKIQNHLFKTLTSLYEERNQSVYS